MKSDVTWHSVQSAFFAISEKTIYVCPK